jgi:hypothetical protein
VADGPTPVSLIVFPHFHAGTNTELVPISPGQAAGGLLENCLSFPENTDETIQALCALAEHTPVYRLYFGDAAEAAKILMREQRSMRTASFEAVG